MLCELVVGPTPRRAAVPTELRAEPCAERRAELRTSRRAELADATNSAPNSAPAAGGAPADAPADAPVLDPDAVRRKLKRSIAHVKQSTGVTSLASIAAEMGLNQRGRDTLSRFLSDKCVPQVHHIIL